MELISVPKVQVYAYRPCSSHGKPLLHRYDVARGCLVVGSSSGVAKVAPVCGFALIACIIACGFGLLGRLWWLSVTSICFYTKCSFVSLIVADRKAEDN